MKESRLMAHKRKVSEKINSGAFKNENKFQTKKSLGQNFLNNRGILELIAKSADIKAGDLILEIGPGDGALTEYLLKEAGRGEGAKIFCIEKDHRLINILNKKFKIGEEGADNFEESDAASEASSEKTEGEQEVKEIEIVEADILKWGSDEYFTKNKINNFEYKIIANIPYYITGAIIEKFLEEKIKPGIMILMVQKEVAQRMVNKGGKGSILSLCTEYYADVEIIKIVSKGSFTPAPKIDSAVIKINLKKENLLDTKYLCLEKKYLELVKIGLAHKRKTLISNLKEYSKKNNKNSNDLEIFDWDKLFEKMNLDKKVRGEDVTFDTWLRLAGEVL